MPCVLVARLDGVGPEALKAGGLLRTTTLPKSN